MYVDMEDKAKHSRRRWLWKTQFQREATRKQIMWFLFGIGIGFVCNTVVLAVLESL